MGRNVRDNIDYINHLLHGLNVKIHDNMVIVEMDNYYLFLANLDDTLAKMGKEIKRHISSMNVHHRLPYINDYQIVFKKLSPLLDRKTKIQSLLNQ